MQSNATRAPQPALLRAAALAVLFAALVAALSPLRRRGQALLPPRVDTLPDIPAFPAEVSRPFSFGFRSLLADVMFLEAIQIHGGFRKPKSAADGAPDDRALNRLLRYAVDLDPKFAGAYRFAGNAMPRHTTDGKVTNVLQAASLLEQGVRERPDDWRIPFTLGVIETYYIGDFQKAAHNLAQAARTPGSPAYVGLLATRAAAEGGDLNFGEQLANAMVALTTEESDRKAWEDRLLDLRMERDLRAIDDGVRRFEAREGHPPHELSELVRAGDLARLPAEPHGGRYELDAEGHAKSTAAKRLRITGRRETTSGLEVVQ